MKTNALVLACFVGLGVSQAGDDKAVAKLQGNWAVTAVHYDGKDFANLKLRFIIKGNNATVEGNDAIKREYAKLTLKIDNSTKPQILDMKVADGSQKDMVFEGIYELKDGEMKICAKIGGNERPANFDIPAGGSNNALLILKKE